MNAAKIERQALKLAARSARRLYTRRCRRYGVSCFDFPTFAAVYPVPAAILLHTVKAHGGRMEW